MARKNDKDNRRMNTKNLGTVYGCWSQIPIDKLHPDSIIYSFGAGEDICFEFMLSGLTDSEIHIFDPTPRAVEHFSYCTKIIKENMTYENNSRFGGGDPKYLSYIKDSNVSLAKLFFHDYGLYDEDSSFEFFYPKNKEHVSLSIDNLQGTQESILLDVKKIDTIMSDLGHNHIDVLKLNIEGAEVKSLLHMLKNTNIRPTYISVKFELARDGLKNNFNLINELEQRLSESYSLIFVDRERFNYTLISKDINK